MTRNEFKHIAELEAGEYDREAFFDLANELAAIGDPKYDEFIELIYTGEFDDFANEKFAAPKMAMHEMAIALGRRDIAKRVENGDFDQ